MNHHFMDWCQKVKDAASRDWSGILQALAGLDDQQTDAKKSRSRGAPCPACGGTDRYSFKDPDSGGWACRRCGGGDGWELLNRVNGWNFSQAIREVACYLHIEPYEGKATTAQQQTASLQKAEKRRRERKLQQDREQGRLSAIHDQRAAYALQEWSRAIPARENHPYLISHKLPPFNLREIQHPVYGWCLLVPLVNEHGQLRNLERINTEGKKRPIKGHRNKGFSINSGGIHGPGIFVRVGQLVPPFI